MANYNNDDLTLIKAAINQKPSVGAADDAELTVYLNNANIVVDAMLGPHMSVPLAIPGPDLVQQGEAEIGGGEWMENHTVIQKGERSEGHFRTRSGKAKINLYINEQAGKTSDPVKGYFEHYQDDSPFDGSRSE